MDKETAVRLANEATGRLVDLDMREGNLKEKEIYEGFYNGFISGLCYMNEQPIEYHAFGVTPKAYIRIIVGLGGRLDLSPIMTAHALMISSECKGETNREGLTMMLGSALAAITAYAQNLTPAFKDGKKFAVDLTDASESNIEALRPRMLPDIKLVEHGARKKGT